MIRRLGSTRKMVAILAGVIGASTVGGLSEVSLGHPLPNIPQERLNGKSKSEIANTGNNNSWRHKYNIGLSGNVDIDVILNFRLRDSVTQAQLNAVGWTWINSANATWDNRFVLVHDDTYRYPIRVQWVQSLTNEHFTIDLHDDQTRENMTNWDVTTSGQTAAHEFGHMLGPFDEYDADGWQDRTLACCPGFNDSTSIMGSTGLAIGAGAKVRHATQFVLEQWAALSDIHSRVPGGVDLVQSLSRFDVVNTTGQAVNNFSLRLDGVKGGEVLKTFQADGTRPTITEDDQGTTILWKSQDILTGDVGRFGVELEEGVNANGHEGRWNDRDVVHALGIQQYWAGDATSPSHIGSTIRNTSDFNLSVSKRFSFEQTVPLSIECLARDLDTSDSNCNSSQAPHYSDFWQSDFDTPTQLAPGDVLYDTFAIQPSSSIVSQVQVFSETDLSNPITVFTNQGIGRETFTEFALAPGDFDLNHFWESADIEFMESALADPDGFRRENGLNHLELLTLGDLDRNGIFDQTDLANAKLWVPTLSEDGRTFPGDFNNDAVLTAADIDLLTMEILNLSQGTINPVFDVNEDGALDTLDITALTNEIANLSQGTSNPIFDVNEDGALDILDIIALTDAILNPSQGTINPVFDVNEDGALNSLDRISWIADIVGTRLGDLNLDGKITVFEDQKILEANLGLPGPFGWADGDVNGDQLVTELDLESLRSNIGFVWPSSTIAVPYLEFINLLGDANKDGLVTGADLISVQQHFGAVGTAPLPGDANSDGQVTGADLIIVQQNFGNTLGSVGTAVPEPASVFLLALAGLGAMARRRRVAA